MIKSYINQFLHYISVELGLSQNTILAYQRDIKTLFRYLSPDDDEKFDFNTITKKQISDYLITLSKSKTSTLARKISALQQFFKFLQEARVTQHNPLDAIKTMKKVDTIPKSIDIETIQALFDSVNHTLYKNNPIIIIRNKLILGLLYGSGLRVSELIQIRWNDIDKDTIRILGKGNRERLVPLSRYVIPLLQEWKNICGDNLWVFCNDKSHITRQRIFQIIKQLTAQANLHNINISPHSLRHSFATHMLENNASILHLQHMLGHASITSTERYTKVTRKVLFDKIYQHHPLYK